MAGCGLSLLGLGMRGQTASAAAPDHAHAGACLIMPFTGRAAQPGLFWLGESFAVGLRQTLRGAAVSVLGRREMHRAFNREGIPDAPTLSHATLMSVAANVDARWLVVGRYQYQAGKLGAQADLIDLRRERMHRFQVAPQALDRLQWTQARLSWKLLTYIRQRGPAPAHGFADFWRRQPPLALPAYESYVRGLLASSARLRLQYFRAAARLQPGYDAANYRLGLWHFHRDQFQGALRWLPRVRPRDAHYWRAQFASGYAALALGQKLRAAEFFREIAAVLPLPEVLNDWALSASRLGQPAAGALLARAQGAAGGYAGTRQKIWANLAGYACRRNQPAQALLWLDKLADATTGPADTAAHAHWQTLMRQLSQSSAPAGAGPQALAPRMEQPSRRFPLRRFQQMETVMAEFAIAKARALPAAAQASRLLAQARQLRRAGALAGARREYQYVLQLPGVSPEDAVQAKAGLQKMRQP